MNITTAIDSCTRPELDMIRTVYYTKNWATAPSFWDYLISRQAQLIRDEHCVTYEITLDDFGHYATITPDGAYRLLMDQLRAAGQAMLYEALSEYHVSDDGLDYLRAATDQASWISEVLTNDDSQTALIKVLNRTEDETMNDYPDTHCFKYGYADHSGPISDLARMNFDEENN